MVRMFSRNFNEIPEKIKNKTFVVGGAVRDKIMSKTPEDFDFVVENTKPETMKNLGFEEVGVNSFPVFLHPETNDEFGLARKETKTGNGYKGFDFKLGVDLETDLKRRDLTVNAIAVDVENGEIFDPFNGRKAIENKTLKHVSKAFADDPVRVLRLARFASRLPEFSIAESTIKLAKTVVPELSKEPGERFKKEVKKVFKEAKKPRRFFDVALKLGALKIIAPELSRLADVPAGTDEHHSEGTAFEHTMLVLEELQNIESNNVRLLFGALGHDLGKGTTDKETLPKHHGHDKRGVEVAENLANRWALSNELKSCMQVTSKQHMRITRLDKPAKVLRTLQLLQNGKGLNLDELLKVVKADALGRIPSNMDVDTDEIKSRFKTASNVLDDIGGNEIKKKFPNKSGKEFGQVLEQERIRELKQRW